MVVEHKDRLTRVGFGWFTVLLGEQGRRVDVANPALDNTTDIMDDLLVIIYSFTARLYGKRGARPRAKAGAEALVVGSESD